MSEKNEPKYETITFGQAVDAVLKGDQTVQYGLPAWGAGEWVTMLPYHSWRIDRVAPCAFRRRVPAKPPQYRPWAGSKEVPFGKMVKRKVPVSGLMLTSWSIHSGDLTVNGVSAKMLFEDYVMDDGSPCGVEVQK